MGDQSFVDSLIEEVVKPGVQQLMKTPYFSELREGKLSVPRLQGWALQHYLHNHAINRGFALTMVKNAHSPELFNYGLYQLSEEQHHPALAKRFGLALGLKEEDFDNATPIFECLAHTSSAIRGMFLGSPAENCATALANETMVGRYSEEFNTYLRRHYGFGDEACQFFAVHAVADVDHVKMASEVIARHADSPRQQDRVREAAEHAVHFKIGKFEGIYRAYG